MVCRSIFPVFTPCISQESSLDPGETAEKALIICSGDAGLHYVYLGNVPGDGREHLLPPLWESSDKQGRVPYNQECFKRENLSIL